MKKLLIILYVIAPALCFGTVSITNVTVGSSPNNEDGDTPRDAYLKINANTTALANQSGGSGQSNGIVNSDGHGTNTAFYIDSKKNTAGRVVVTNDSILTNSVIVEFQNMGPTNFAGIGFSTNAGDYSAGKFWVDIAHGGVAGPPGDVTHVEMKMESPGDIAIAPAEKRAGHIQIGLGGGQPMYMYMQGQGNTGVGQVANSFPFAWRTLYNASSNIFDKLPNIIARWVGTNQNGNLYELQFSGDLPGQDAWVTNTVIPSQHFGWGTNGGAAYVDYVLLEGQTAGVVTNRINIGTNEIDTIGNIVALNPTVDSWTCPNKIIAGPLLTAPNNVVIGADNVSADLRVQNGGGATTANSFFVSGGGWFGSFFPSGGVSIGTNNKASVAALDVWGGIFTSNRISFPTGYVAASFAVVPGAVSLVPSNGALWKVWVGGTNLVLP